MEFAVQFVTDKPAVGWESEPSERHGQDN